MSSLQSPLATTTSQPEQYPRLSFTKQSPIPTPTANNISTCKITRNAPAPHTVLPTPPGPSSKQLHPHNRDSLVPPPKPTPTPTSPQPPVLTSLLTMPDAALIQNERSNGTGTGLVTGTQGSYSGSWWNDNRRNRFRENEDEEGNEDEDDIRGGCVRTADGGYGMWMRWCFCVLPVR